MRTNKRKNIITFMVIFFVMAWQQVDAQKRNLPSKWRFNSIGTKAQPDFYQSFSNLSNETLLRLVKDPTELTYNMDGLNKKTEYELEGTSVGVFVSFSKPIINHWSQKLELEVNFYTYAEVYVEYTSQDYITGSNNSDEYIGWCLLQGRVDFGGSYFIDRSLGKGFNFKFGPTLIYGTSFNDQVMIFEKEENIKPDQVTDAQRTQFIYAQFGIHLSKSFWDKVSVSVGQRWGGGKQLKQDNQISYNAFQLGLAYLLK